MTNNFGRRYIQRRSDTEQAQHTEHEQHEHMESFLGRAFKYVGLPLGALYAGKEGIEYASDGSEPDILAKGGAILAAGYGIGKLVDDETREVCYHISRNGIEQECGHHEYGWWQQRTGDVTGLAAGIFEATQAWDLIGNFNINNVDELFYVPAVALGIRGVRRFLRRE